MLRPLEKLARTMYDIKNTQNRLKKGHFRRDVHGPKCLRNIETPTTTYYGNSERMKCMRACVLFIFYFCHFVPFRFDDSCRLLFLIVE